MCPFLHYIERRRDKVIQDDFEFKDFIAQQDKICQEFVQALNLYQIGSKVDFYKCSERESVNHQGLPSSSYMFGRSISAI